MTGIWPSHPVQGQTPLMIATQKKWPGIVKLLVSLGATTTLKDQTVNQPIAQPL